MGTRNAEAKANDVVGLTARGGDGGPPLAGKPDAVVVIGLCGGLTQSLREQQIVAYTECLSTGRGSVLHVIPDSHLSAPRPLTRLATLATLSPRRGEGSNLMRGSKASLLTA
jgi:hypothetical protein